MLLKRGLRKKIKIFCFTETQFPVKQKKQGCRNSPAKKFFLFLITSEASNKVLKCKAFQVLT